MKSPGPSNPTPNPTAASDKGAPPGAPSLVYASGDAARKPPGMLRPALGLLGAVTLVGALYVMSGRDRAVPPPAPQPAPLVAVPEQRAAEAVPEPPRPDWARVFRDEVAPLMDRSLARKQEAADRAVATLRQRLDNRRRGIPAFAEDVTGWGTRFGVVKRMTGDAWERWWNDNPNAGAARTYIQQKFRDHVLSERALEGDLGAALEQFRADLEADRNLLLAEVRVPLKTAAAPVAVDDPAWEAVREDVMRRAAEIAQQGTRDNLTQAVAAFAAGGVAEVAGRRLVVQLLARVAPAIAARLASTAAVAGAGATATGAGGGGAVGTLAGPAGTIVGAGIGIAIGAAIDWWMTERFKDRLEAQCHRFIGTVQQQLIHGTPGVPGIDQQLDQAVRAADLAQRRAILDRMLAMDDDRVTVPTTAPVTP